MLSKQKRAMCRRARKPRELKVRHYAACMIFINEYFSDLPGAKECDKIGEMDINEILLNIMPNGCSTQVYVQGFMVKLLLKKMLICLNAWKLRKQFMKVL